MGTAKRFGVPGVEEEREEGGRGQGGGLQREGLGRKEGRRERRRVCGTVATEATLSQERSSFDLII